MAAELAEDPATSLIATVTTAAALGALRAAGEVWITTCGTADLGTLVQVAFEILAAGLRSPAPS